MENLKLFLFKLHLKKLKNLPVVQDTWVQSLGQEDPLEKEITTHYSIFVWKSHGQRSLVDCSPGGHKRVDITLRINNKTTQLISACMSNSATAPQGSPHSLPGTCLESFLDRKECRRKKEFLQLQSKYSNVFHQVDFISNNLSLRSRVRTYLQDFFVLLLAIPESGICLSIFIAFLTC